MSDTPRTANDQKWQFAAPPKGVCPKHGVQQSFTLHYRTDGMTEKYQTPNLCPICWIDWATANVTHLGPLPTPETK